MMQPLGALTLEIARNLKIILTDIDDTLTSDGKLPAISYVALERLKDAGFTVIPITGRPAGWCDMIARFWPVDGIIGENGAFYFRYDSVSKRMIRRYWKSAEERQQDSIKLAMIRHDVLTRIPGCAISADQAYREADLAVDFCEDVPALPQKDIDAICDVFAHAGATAKVSSIHVNGWFGSYDKLSMTERMLSHEFGIDVASQTENILFCGDSPNDAPMFAFFPYSVGVANVIDFQDRMSSLPRFVTPSRGGYGFAELAEILLSSRV